MLPNNDAFNAIVDEQNARGVTPDETDLIRTLRILRDLGNARDRLAPLNDHRVRDADRRKLITSAEGKSAIFALFLAIDTLLTGDRRFGEREPDAGRH